MASFGTLSDFFSGQIVPLGILAACIVGGLIMLSLSNAMRQRRMAKARRGEDVDTFVLHLASYGFDPDLTRATYGYLVDEEDVAFPIRHTDRLDLDLRISEEEVQAMVDHLLKQFHRECLPGLRNTFVTVEDVLRFVQGCPVLSLRRSGQYSSITTSGMRRVVGL